MDTLVNCRKRKKTPDKSDLKRIVVNLSGFLSLKFIFSYGFSGGKLNKKWKIFDLNFEYQSSELLNGATFAISSFIKWSLQCRCHVFSFLYFLKRADSHVRSLNETKRKPAKQLVKAFHRPFNANWSRMGKKSFSFLLWTRNKLIFLVE